GRSYLDRLGVRAELSFAAVRAPAGLARDLGIVVVELVTNAARHAFRGRGGRVWIDLDVDRRGQLTCSVADDGLGFDPAVVERRISGLGLVHRLVSGFDGVLEVTPRSARGGATFSVKLSLPQRPARRTPDGAGLRTAATAGRDRELETARPDPIL